jgi:hypothetical protein
MLVEPMHLASPHATADYRSSITHSDKHTNKAKSFIEMVHGLNFKPIILLVQQSSEKKVLKKRLLEC